MTKEALAASDWRTYAKKNQWHKFDIRDVLVQDHPELMIMLKEFLPKRVFGHGVEFYEDFITPEDARDKNEYNAAFMLSVIRISTEGLIGDVEFDFFGKAERLAKSVLFTQLGVQYEGCQHTYLYNDKNGGWHQLPSNVGVAIVKRRDDRRSVLNETDFKKWALLYPWRRTLTLHQLLSLQHGLAPNSPAEHAAHLLGSIEIYQDSLNNLGAGIGQFGMELQRLAEASFVVGRQYAILRKKPYEEYAAKKIEEIEKNRQNGMNGGQAERKAERYRVLNELAMKQRDKFAFASEKENIRFAKRLAAEYDSGADTPLFMERKKPLSTGWYGEWLSQFLMQVRRLQ